MGDTRLAADFPEMTEMVGPDHVWLAHIDWADDDEWPEEISVHRGPIGACKHIFEWVASKIIEEKFDVYGNSVEMAIAMINGKTLKFRNGIRTWVQKYEVRL